jgi:predicted RNA binding protein YcfA (HicA-like mRNA interferase family)
MKFRELENVILADGWQYKNTTGSHNHYIHPVKSGKVTIPNHKGDIPKGVVQSIYKQAGLK